MRNDILFKDLVGLYRKIEFNSIGSYGSLKINNQKDCEFLNKVLKNTQKYGIYLENGENIENHTVTLEVGVPKLGFGVVFLDRQEMVSVSGKTGYEPEEYYIISEKIYNKD